MRAAVRRSISVSRRRQAATPRRAVPWLALVLLGGSFAGCSDFQSPGDPTSGLPDLPIANPSFALDIAPVLEARCALGGCHTAASQQGQLVLEPDAAYDEIVNVTSVSGQGMLLVAPGDSAGSWLVRMISPDATLRMPLASRPLTTNQIENIRRWIELGAERN